MKQCSRCKIRKPRNGFYKNKSRCDGLSYSCKTCVKKWYNKNKKLCYSYMKKNYDKKRKFYVEYKKSLKCQQCGENHPACLVFHHRNPKEKDFRIGSSIGIRGIKTVMAEIAKCDVLCANCHRKLHYELRKK